MTRGIAGVKRKWRPPMPRRRDPIAKDLRTPKYRPRVVQDRRAKVRDKEINLELRSPVVKNTDKD